MISQFAWWVDGRLKPHLHGGTSEIDAREMFVDILGQYEPDKTKWSTLMDLFINLAVSHIVQHTYTNFHFIFTQFG